MKRLLVILSIMMLLGSNIAMALNIDCSKVQQQSSLDHAQDNDQDNGTDGDDTDFSDNCCHSISHFVGIYPDSSYSSLIISSFYIPLAPTLASSQTYQPATPPPNV